MSLASPFYLSRLSQASAEAVATDGLCGDRLHIDKCAITECTIPKCVLVYDADARYSFVHVEAPPAGSVLRVEPHVYAPTSASRSFLGTLKDLEALHKTSATGLAKAEADGFKPALVKESKTTSNGKSILFDPSNFPDPPMPPASKATSVGSGKTSPPPHVRGINTKHTRTSVHTAPAAQAAVTPATESAGGGPQSIPSDTDPAARIPAPVEAFGRSFIVSPVDTTEQTVQRSLDQRRMRPPKENAVTPQPATTAFGKPVAATHPINSTKAAKSAKPGVKRTGSSKITETNVEEAIKDAIENVAATTLASKPGAKEHALADEDAWELVDRPEEEEWVKVSSRKKRV
ncbi:hypothetical protein B0A55_01986 [Friedmanniomyces simplex]|uniref:Uncharacterized protein n=1 Tax=Friedmanniomyces simplex TaxID=329884 RepID=A0A4U0XPG3_9PEZI|nr:hypothetical protein B0A55_01986 [Friedmanniomyces simplex]